MRKLYKLFAALLALTGFVLIFQACQKDPVTSNEVVSNDIIKGQYIVVYHENDIRLKTDDMIGYKEGIDHARSYTREILQEYQVGEENLGYVYHFALKGFSATLTDDELIKLKQDPRVKYIEPDGIVTASLVTQNTATWGLDRVDQRNLPLNSTYTYDATGTGVSVYIIDTGINYSHNDFGNRASFGFDAFDGDGKDCNGHGTHVAGTVGGTTYGVAKSVNLVAVRVLDCNGSGTSSGVIAGMDWVAANAVKPAVANMSLGGAASTATDEAVARLFDAGVPVVVAAGNGNRAGRAQDACNYSPARAPEAYTIGATTNTDAKASYSNYGNCVNLFAPGSSVTSNWYSSNTAINTISGTSMASPHVAGAAALYLQNNTSANPQQVYDFISSNSTRNIVTSSNTVNNHLLYTLENGGGGTVPVNNPPDANFTYYAVYLNVSFDASSSSDSGGSIVGYAWNFGDGSTGSGVTASHTYAAAGSYTVSLTVTDNEGATGSKEQTVTVIAEPSGGDGFVLSATGNKERGRISANLSWTGTSASSIDVFRDGEKIATVSNSGSYVDNIGLGGGSYVYKVCEAGSTVCSNEVTVTF